jgi:hypothetical protein
VELNEGILHNELEFSGHPLDVMMFRVWWSCKGGPECVAALPCKIRLVLLLCGLRRRGFFFDLDAGTFRGVILSSASSNFDTKSRRSLAEDPHSRTFTKQFLAAEICQ